MAGETGTCLLVIRRSDHLHLVRRLVFPCVQQSFGTSTMFVKRTRLHPCVSSKAKEGSSIEHLSHPFDYRTTFFSLSLPVENSVAMHRLFGNLLVDCRSIDMRSIRLLRPLDFVAHVFCHNIEIQHPEGTLLKTSLLILPTIEHRFSFSVEWSHVCHPVRIHHDCDRPQWSIG